MPLHVYTSLVNTSLLEPGDGLTEFEVKCLQAAEQCGELVALLELACDGRYEYFDVGFQNGMIVRALSSYHLCGFTEDGINWNHVSPFNGA